LPRQRLSRKELTEKDEITSILERGTIFVIDNAKPFLAGAVVVITVVLAIVGWNFYSSTVETSAQLALSEVISAYNNIDGQSDEARFNAAIAEAAIVESEHAGTQAVDIARYYAALSNEGLGNTGESDRILRDLIESGDETIRDNARFALAESYKTRDDFPAAIAEYQILAESPDFSRGAVLFELGRLYEEIAQPEEALTYYESLVIEYQNSPFRAEADRALRRLRAEDGSPS
jgi:tetratricopeptide (TPR) repeat protein